MMPPFPEIKRWRKTNPTTRDAPWEQVEPVLGKVRRCISDRSIRRVSQEVLRKE